MPTEPRILHVAGEAVPLVKTGGLADVAGALPDAQHLGGADVRLLLPGYGVAIERAREQGPVRTVVEHGDTRLLETRLPHGAIAWLLASPAFVARGNRPYDRPDGTPWPDNAAAFDALARMAAALADDAFGLGWRADVVHAHDWHAGLVPVHVERARVPAATVFTIHNLAYQGIFPLSTRAELGLPGWLDHWSALELHGQLAFIKGGIALADRVTTVSATYAREITTPAFGEGLEGLLAHRGERLSGITNGIDVNSWNPASDPALPVHFDAAHPGGKARARAALLAELGLEAAPGTPVLAYIGRLATQKGADVLLDALEDLLALPSILVVLGDGDPRLRARLEAAASRHPESVHVHFGFDEPFARRLYAGADMLLMPSRFEPCGLAQLNAMRYGAIPVVRRTGGLAETVTDASRETLADGTATGFQFDAVEARGLVVAARRARALFREPGQWRSLVENAMRRDSSWTAAARAYDRLYATARADRHRLLGLDPGADRAT